MAKKKKKSVINRMFGVIYARYSSHAQKDASIEQQIYACSNHAEKMGVTVIDSYEDRAITGKTDKRPNFQRMIKDAEKGKFDYVIAWKSSRMGRNMLEAMMNEARLNDMGIRVLYVEEDFDDSAAGRFALRNMMNVNQFYSESMAEDIRRGMYNNAENCMVTGIIPFGYKADESLHYVIDAPKDEIVREIYTRVSVGESFVDILNDLNARGIKTARGNIWSKNSFHSLITNERYRGIYIYGTVRKEGGIPRIVSDELFFKVQEVIKNKKNTKSRHRADGDYVLTGKLFCGYCKEPMTGMSGTGKSGNLHFYYSCNKKRYEHDCEKKNIQRDTIETAVAKAIQDYILQPNTINRIADDTMAYVKKAEQENEIALLEAEQQEIQRAIKNVMEAIKQGIITESTKETLIELEAKNSKLSADILAKKADVLPVTREHIIAGLELLKDGDVTDKTYQAKLFDTLLVAVFLFNDYMKIIFGFPGKNKTINVPFSNDMIEKIEKETGSCKVPKGAPLESYTNTYELITVDSVFVLLCPLKI